MVCDDMLMKVRAASTEQVSIVSLASVLGVSGLAVLLWMLSAGWVDTSGIVVGVIFVVLTVMQVAFTVVWWKSADRTEQSYSIRQEEECVKEKVELTESGQHKTSTVRLAYTDGAQEVDMVKV